MFPNPEKPSQEAKVFSGKGFPSSGRQALRVVPVSYQGQVND